MFAILLAIIAAATLMVILMAVSGKSKKSGDRKASRNAGKSKSVLLKECQKKLSKDPHNVQALLTLSDIYFNAKDYEKASPLYESLSNLASMHVEINQVLVMVRLGICAYNTGKIDAAYGSFNRALRLEPRNYECNYYLGRILYDRKDYEKAVICFKRALNVRPESTEIYQYIGFVLYKNKKYRDSLGFLRKALDENPGDKETLFTFASALEECGMVDKALKIFMHLRTDPTYGAESCIACGSIHQKMGQADKALEDYSIALKLENIATETKLAASYKMAHVYLGQQNIAKALPLLKQIQEITPTYKDVSSLVSRYQELNQNSNLQAYLMSGTSDFVALCRKFVVTYYPDSNIRIEDINVNVDSVEVLCGVESAKWNDTELFRFFRSSGAIGELYIRDFHNKIKEMKCDRGFCVTAGSFTEEAKRYAENRPIDLLEKARLVQILKKIT